MASDLSDLVENPRETMEVELKQWVDLADAQVRANVARHLAALSNHGGGYLVFGFKDDLTPDANRPQSLAKFNRDQLSSVIKRYLTPIFECEISIVEDSKGEPYPIVRVPGHGTTPVVARADGPQDNKGRVQGIVSGTYYIRKPGPESAPIAGAEEWTPIIRRCLLSDRDNLLRDIGEIVRGPQEVAVPAAARLKIFHDDTWKRYAEVTAQMKQPSWPVELAGNCEHMSYLIAPSSGTLPALPGDKFTTVLRAVNLDVRDFVWTGWSMFFLFAPPEYAPQHYPENADGTGSDLLETNLLGQQLTLPDFWRVAPDGRASLVRPYREDQSDMSSRVQRNAGTWMSPETILREITELVSHARLFARHFDGAATISFRCTWC